MPIKVAHEVDPGVLGEVAFRGAQMDSAFAAKSRNAAQARADNRAFMQDIIQLGGLGLQTYAMVKDNKRAAERERNLEADREFQRGLQLRSADRADEQLEYQRRDKMDERQYRDQMAERDEQRFYDQQEIRQISSKVKLTPQDRAKKAQLEAQRQQLMDDNEILTAPEKAKELRRIDALLSAYPEENTTPAVKAVEERTIYFDPETNAFSGSPVKGGLPYVLDKDGQPKLLELPKATAPEDPVSKATMGVYDTKTLPKRRMEIMKEMEERRKQAADALALRRSDPKIALEKQKALEEMGKKYKGDIVPSSVREEFRRRFIIPEQELEAQANAPVSPQAVNAAIMEEVNGFKSFFGPDGGPATPPVVPGPISETMRPNDPTPYQVILSNPEMLQQVEQAITAEEDAELGRLVEKLKTADAREWREIQAKIGLITGRRAEIEQEAQLAPR